MADLQQQIDDLNKVVLQVRQQIELMKGDTTVLQNLINSVEKSLTTFRNSTLNELNTIKADIAELKAKLE